MPGLVLDTGTGLGEPMWRYMEAGRAPADAPPGEPSGAGSPHGVPRSHQGTYRRSPVRRGGCYAGMAEYGGVIAVETAAEHLLELQFDDGRQRNQADMRPGLPLAPLVSGLGLPWSVGLRVVNVPGTRAPDHHLGPSAGWRLSRSGQSPFACDGPIRALLAGLRLISASQISRASSRYRMS